jgi:hypothetical protein
MLRLLTLFNGENYQKWHESGGTDQYFLFPSAEDKMIPEWFNHQSRETESGTTFPFWFRNKFPFIMFLISIEESNMDYDYANDFETNDDQIIDDVWMDAELSIDLWTNDFDRNVHYVNADFGRNVPPGHTYVLNLKTELVEAFEKNEWISAEIKLTCKATFNLYFKEENNADDIHFTNPYGKRKFDKLEHIYRNTSLSQCSQPLLKKQRLLDVEDLDIKSCEYEFGGNSPNKINMDYLKLFKRARCAAPYISHSKSIIIMLLCVIMCVSLFLFKEKDTMLSLGELTCPT